LLKFTIKSLNDFNQNFGAKIFYFHRRFSDRDSASEALTAMSENVSVYRAINAVAEGGLNHKSAVVRGEVARIFDLVSML
jgi:hypothetical protein